MGETPVETQQNEKADRQTGRFVQIHVDCARRRAARDVLQVQVERIAITQAVAK